MAEVKINLPISENDVRQLKCGDIVYLSGTIYTARDAAHKYFYEGGEPPVSLSGLAVYHCGPVTIKDKDDNWQITAAGPTTSMREEPYMAKVIADNNIRFVIGKGGMGASTAEACIEHGCVYLSAYGGCAQLLADKIEKVSNVYFYEEFGAPEAMWELQVKEFPAVVTIDSKGGNLHSEVQDQSSKLSKG